VYACRVASIVLYQFAPDHGLESGSPFCIKVHRALRLKGLAYRAENVSPARIARLNPKTKKLPVLQVDDRWVTDSTRILRAVDALAPEPSLYPAPARDRALDHLLEDWADESLYWFAVHQRWVVDEHFDKFAEGAFSRMQAPLRWVAPTLARRFAIDQVEKQGLGRLTPNEVMQRLEQHLSTLEVRLQDRRFLVDDQVRAADLAVFGVVRTLVAPYMVEPAAMVRSKRTLSDWLQRVDDVTRPEKAEAVPA